MVNLIPKDPVDTPDLANAIKTTAAGTYDPTPHGRMVAIVFDSKVAGEASSKPQHRLPPFQQDECRRMLDAVRNRHGTTDDLPEGDAYIFLDGGRAILDRMTSYFAGKAYTAKTVHISLDPESVTKRLERVRGVAVHNVHETMRICTAMFPRNLRSMPRQHYSGTTATNGLGPVVLADVPNLWHVMWPVKKDMYGKNGIIPVGGRAPGDDDESDTEAAPAAPRTAGTCEPVTWHSMPQLFWQEILFDFQVGAVIDLTPADGALAMAAVHLRIPYTGLTWSKRHSDELLIRLESLVVAGATREGDPWYEPRLVEALMTSPSKPNTTPGAGTSPEPTAKAKAKPGPKAGKKNEGAGKGDGKKEKKDKKSKKAKKHDDNGAPKKKPKTNESDPWVSASPSEPPSDLTDTDPSPSE